MATAHASRDQQDGQDVEAEQAEERGDHDDPPFTSGPHTQPSQRQRQRSLVDQQMHWTS
jgi:hypothetical protein